jgi:ankyrin repeat protein
VTTILNWVPVELLTTKTRAWHIEGQVKKYPVVATLLGHAIKNKNHLLATMLVNRGVAIEHPVVFDWTPLMFASVQHDLSMVLLFLAKGAQVDATDQRGNSSLHFVAQTGNTELVATLVHHGANMVLLNQKGFKPRDLAA